MPFLSIASALLGNEWARLAVAVVLAFCLGFMKGWASVPRVDVAAVTRNAEEARDAVWQRKLAEVNQTHEENLAAALDAAAAVPFIAADADVARLCDASPSCRDKALKQRERLQGLPADHLEPRR